MALLALWLTLAVVACLFPSGLAGPACARKYYQTSQCIQRCKSRWGFPGSMMGMDPWGAVILPSGATLDEYITKACGQPTNGSSSVGPIQNISGNNGTNTSSESSSFSSSVVTSTVSPSLIFSTSTPAFSSQSSALHTFNSSLGFQAFGKSTSSSRIASSSTTSSTQATSRTSSKASTIFKPTTTSTPSTTFTTPKPTTTSPPPKTTEAAPTTTSESSATTAASSSDGNGSSASNSDVQAYLEAHNSIRVQHGASALTWSNDAASKAQEWANNCQFKHSGGSLGPFGENLAAGTGSGYTIATAVKSWTDEVSQYDPSNPVPSHFTQVVWKATTQVGCAVQDCSGIFDASFGLAHFHVCEYSVQGNVIGEFAENVQA